MDIMPHLRLMVEKGASDLFYSTGTPVHIKIDGDTLPIGKEPLAPGETKSMAYSIMNDDQLKNFEATLEANIAISVKNVGRFRVNVFQQRGEVAMVIRYIKRDIPSIEELHLPLILKDLVMEMRGLILMVGSTGSGKSTTLASMLDHRNTVKRGHILTVEDPIEYIHHHKLSVVNQREIGLDTLSFKSALQNAMREAPDVILIGEIRDEDTMRHAIAYAETGHLCLATLHANNTFQTFDRIMNFFPPEQHNQLKLELSMNLQAIVSQRLVPGLNSRYVPAVEILLNSPYISELIRKGEFAAIPEVQEKSTNIGMQTFDQSLYDLYDSGKVSLEEALRNANSRNNLALKIRLAEGGSTEDADRAWEITDEEFRL